MKDVIFLYSHGFATHADDKGLFAEIKSLFPNIQHVLFEYDEWNGNEAVAASFSERARKLQAKYAEVRSRNPDAEINLICHSQGSIVAMLAGLDGVNKTVMLAPPMIYGSPTEEYERQKLENSVVLPDGTIIRNRSSGDKTIMKPEYFDDFALISDMQGLCNQLSKKTELLIVDALNDTIVRKDYSRLNDKIVVKIVDADHDLKARDGSRKETKKVLKEFLD